MSRPPTLLGALIVAGLAASLGCGPTDGKDARVIANVAESGPAFRPVAAVLIDRCGSLDCHGSKYRNMRLYGFASARLDPSHAPDSPETTADEVDRNYEAVVSLEPDRIREVVAEGGRGPERLTFFRKSQALEAHKGGQRILPGDAADRCLRSWLSGATDGPLCRSAVPRLAEKDP